MRVSQVVRAQESDVIEQNRPEPAPREVLVRVSLCGVCASELPRWRSHDQASPIRLGHEPFGYVEKVGSEVTRFTVGNRVTGLFHGGFSDYCAVSEDLLLSVPNNVPDESAMGEPLACLVNAARRTRIEFADTVVLIGLGFMGLGILQLVKLRGPSRIVAIDVRQESLDRALSLGATEAYTPDSVPDGLFLTEFSQWNSDAGADVVIEASGSQGGLDLAGKLVKAHGILSILGYHQGAPRQVDVGMWNWKAIDVVNAHVRRSEDLLESMRIGLELESSGQIDLGSLITHRYTLDDVDAAFKALVSKPQGFIKSVIVPGDAVLAGPND